MRLLEHPLVMVLGKGGVGRTTLTASLALAAAEQGKRACVVELGDSSALPERFGLQGRSSNFRPGSPGVDVWSLNLGEALNEFARRKLHLPGFVRGVVRNRFVTTFVDAVPGMHDVVLLGKIENLISEPYADDPRYDTIIVDAPATGHGLTLLLSASTMAQITKVGPFYELARTIEVFLRDPARTALAMVSLPEALPVSESLELVDALGHADFGTHTVIVNQVEPELLPSAPPLTEVRARLSDLPGGRNLTRLAEEVAARTTRQRDAIATLRTGLAKRGMAAPVTVPALGAPIEVGLGSALASVL